jgi:hypothetical protein
VPFGTLPFWRVIVLKKPQPGDGAHPGLGIDAALAAAFDGNPLVWKLRETTRATITEAEMRRHPEQHPGDPRAAAIIAQLAIRKRLARTGPTQAFASGPKKTSG